MAHHVVEAPGSEPRQNLYESDFYTWALEQARALWLPTITVGGDYNRHDGKIQDTSGSIIDSSRSSLMFGLGTGIGAAAIFSPSLPARNDACL